MWFAPNLNHTQWGVRAKLLVLGVLIWLIWDVKQSRLYDLIFSWWMDEIGTIGAGSGPRW